MGRANRDNRWLLIFQLVFDESGLGQNHAFVFAGFLGPLRAWEQFADLWEPLLKRRQQLTAKGFKRMVSQRPNHRRVHSFVEVLVECKKLYRISVTIPRAAYQEAILAELPKWEGRLDKATIALISNEYYLAFYLMVENVLLPMVASLDDRAELEVIYDENIQEAEKVESGYAEFIKQTPEAKQFRRTPRSENDERFLPLQAAHLFAWHVHKDYVEKQHGRQHEGSTWKLLNTLPEYPPLVLTEHDLRKIIAWDTLEERMKELQS